MSLAQGPSRQTNRWQRPRLAWLEYHLLFPKPSGRRDSFSPAVSMVVGEQRLKPSVGSTDWWYACAPGLGLSTLKDAKGAAEKGMQRRRSRPGLTERH